MTIQTAAAPVRRALDHLAFAWIAAAPVVVLIGVLAGAVDLPALPGGGGPPRPAVPQVAPAPVDAGTGQMRGRFEGEWIELPLLAVDFRVDVTGVMARGVATQSYSNPTHEVLEVEYVFPLPDGAAVSHMEMRIGSRRIVSVVQERAEARKTYETAKREGKKAALVESRRANLFRTTAANINPGERVEVVLHWVQELRWEDGSFRLVVPLTYTARYDLATRSAECSDRDTTDDLPASSPEVDLEVRIDLGVPLDAITSPSHAIDRFLDGDVEVVTPAYGPIPADRDFVLRWRPLLGPDPEPVVHLEDRDDGRFALVTVFPPADDLGNETGLPTRTLFVLDVSGSMAGPSLVQLKVAMDRALERLRPDDTFAMTVFSDHVDPYLDRFAPASPDAVRAARDWVRVQGIQGGTRIDLALEDALDRFADAPDDGRVRRVIFLTDGAVSNHDALFARLARADGGVRLHMVGIGAAPNRYLVTHMAQLGGGMSTFVQDPNTAAQGIDRFLARLERPVLTDLAVDWTGAVPDAVVPPRLPDVHAGEPVTVSARFAYGDDPGAMIVRGTVPEGFAEYAVDLGAPSANGSGVAMRFAQRRVDSLMAGLHTGIDPASVRADVLAVALAHGLVTRYTSRVAVEQTPTALGATRMASVGNRVAGALPIGGTRDRSLALVGLLLVGAGVAVWSVVFGRS